MKIGILGGGQLARMMALASYRLGMDIRILDPDSKAPAFQVAKGVCASFDDEKALTEFAKDLDVVTYERESIPLDALAAVGEVCSVFPPAHALKVSADRYLEKQALQRLGIPCAPFAKADSEEELAEAIEKVGIPCVIKTRREGYDGKGQQRLTTPPSSIAEIWQELDGKSLTVEAWVEFDREVSQLIAFSRNGDWKAYPLSENEHAHGILQRSYAPANRWLDASIGDKARDYVLRLGQEFSYTGVLALELFLRQDQLIANEIAPRVHNSGHWTMNAGVTCQFENHIRAITGLALGATEPDGCFGMVNLIGEVNVDDWLRVPTAQVHLYGKQGRPGRKIGHVNFKNTTILP